MPKREYCAIESANGMNDNLRKKVKIDNNDISHVNDILHENPFAHKVKTCYNMNYLSINTNDTFNGAKNNKNVRDRNNSTIIPKQRNNFDNSIIDLSQIDEIMEDDNHLDKDFNHEIIEKMQKKIIDIESKIRELEYFIQQINRSEKDDLRKPERWESYIN